MTEVRDRIQVDARQLKAAADQIEQLRREAEAGAKAERSSLRDRAKKLAGGARKLARDRFGPGRFSGAAQELAGDKGIKVGTLGGSLAAFLTVDKLADFLQRWAEGQSFKQIFRDQVSQLPPVALWLKIRAFHQSDLQRERTSLLQTLAAQRALEDVQRRLASDPAFARRAARVAASEYAGTSEAMKILERAQEQREGGL